MIRLGDIAKKNRDLLKALALWETAKPLFERSSQAKRVQDIDERVEGISAEVKEQHHKNLAQVGKLNVSEGRVDTGKPQPSNLQATKDKEVVDDLTTPSTTRATNSHQLTNSSFRISKATSPHSQAAFTPPVSEFTQAEEMKTGTFAIYSPRDEKPEPETQDVSFTAEDLTYSQANLGVGGCLISVHEPAEAASWIEDNWDNPLLAFIRNSGCSGPFAWMLSPVQPALAIFGSFEDPIVVNMADSLAYLSGFPTVIRPLSDNPALTLLSRETDPQNGFIQFGGAASNDEETRSDGDDEANTFGNENTPGDSGDDGGQEDDLDRAGSDNHGLNTVDEYKRHRGYKGGQEAGDGDGDGDGGGPTLMDDKWESQLHRTRVKLRLKLNALHTYAVTIGYTFKFTINRETEIPIDFKDITRPLSQPEVIAFVDFKIETRPRETQVDRSYASIGFVAHRRKSIIEREFMHRGFDLPDKLYKHGQHQQIQRGIKAALGFSQGSPLATATISYNQNNDAILEVTDSKVMPRCRVDYETGDEWDKGNKSYSSYNIAYQLQGMRLDAERSELYPLEVKVGMGINLHPAGSKKPLPQMSFISRNQVLIWISDSTSKTRIRGIVVLMNASPIDTIHLSYRAYRIAELPRQHSNGRKVDH
ncbi:hypothetical protein B0H16DRAFT_1605980 [Mycena metata]|uniref:Uncharacterized protein n=1 Tax=Mycena metata TaxID=1033252 RepID=A0AAD7MIY5_9AGAR|nr:hypothetical protein B0H16DRAFT_1605980 [Mycena metata]